MLFIIRTTLGVRKRMQDVKGLWQSVLGELEVSVSDAHYKTWLKPTYIISREEGHIIVGVPNVFNKLRLEKTYDANIRQILAKLDGEIRQVEYKVVAKGQVTASEVATVAHP